MYEISVEDEGEVPMAAYYFILEHVLFGFP